MHPVKPKRTTFHFCTGSKIVGWFRLESTIETVPQTGQIKNIHNPNFVFSSIPPRGLFISVGGMTTLQHKIGAY